MVVLVILLWLMALVLIAVYPYSETTRWAASIGFGGGAGGLASVLGAGTDRPSHILIADSILSSVGHFWTPVAVLMFALIYSGILQNQRTKRIWTIIFLLPAISMLFSTEIYPDFLLNHQFFAVWVAPYVLVCNGLLVYTGWKETRLSIKKQKILTAIIIVPILSFALVTNILLEAMNISGMWRYNTYIIGFQFILFCVFVVKYGFLGVQVQFVQQSRSVQAQKSGTSLFNHAIKNEVSKLDLMVKQFNQNLLSESQRENLHMMQQTTQHLRELSQRVQSKLDTIELRRENFDPHLLIKAAQKELLLADDNIEIHTHIRSKHLFYGDPIHIQEVINNIVKNAKEALRGNGDISIDVYEARKYMVLDITDNGPGMDKIESQRVMDPFYSKKQQTESYGLGLTYCFNIMQQHGGDVTVQSQKNRGTTFSLWFPKSKHVWFSPGTIRRYSNAPNTSSYH
ncbi:sensor histidine kinase [Marinococcus halophilus]|uniref:sensor histidine kinase n=1 Tax=Marinococcus halophilus TaxID=1371 RepID=UPI0009A5EC92|nr:sensor histidine kinase [Marinococcus halophilus]